tara:strand:+ start:471 stop:890 length:420 start_codon:yes stop_codon:yes gene_type:complete
MSRRENETKELKGAELVAAFTAAGIGVVLGVYLSWRIIIAPIYYEIFTSRIETTINKTTTGTILGIKTRYAHTPEGEFINEPSVIPFRKSEKDATKLQSLIESNKGKKVKIRYEGRLHKLPNILQLEYDTIDTKTIEQP